MSATNSNLAKTYQKKTDKQHVLDNPDTYTGSMEPTDYDTYVFDNETSTIVRKNLTIIPGLYKLFDEGIVNCRDHQVRTEQDMIACKPNTIPVSYIDVSITEDGTITMVNDGNGIDIVKHPEHNIWIPEMIFGHLRTSTNYDKEQKKIVGGKNGFGFKLVLIWSTWGKIETVDHVRGLKYIQEFTDNLTVIQTPIIKKCAGKPYTSVSFKPDYKRLGMTELSSDMINLFKRRVYDIAAITKKHIKVKYNGEIVPVKSFQQYVDLYIGNKTDTPRVYEEANERWEYAVCLAPKEEFTQVSFVNGIYTGKGGKHVDYILNQIVRKLTLYIAKKKKIEVKSSTIKEQIMLFVRCDIENPAFDSQTKDYMNTLVAKFGSTCEVSDKFIEKVAKIGVMDAACALTEVKDTKALKKTDGSKTKTIRGIPKLNDANFAGTEQSHQCTIIFCEGDSAKAGIISGLSKEDRNIIGVYPMRGKLLNVRGEAPKRILENKEINEIKQILGLKTGKAYTSENIKETLRYGKILFMTDQDLDGSHIKGLGINLFDSEWKSLVEVPGFIGFMNTPILKARKGTQEMIFYNDGEYEQWKNTNSGGTKGWTIKYYKGLGTSTSKEFKEYFERKKIVNFISTGADSSDAIDMVFNKKRASDRKEWLTGYNRDSYLDTGKLDVTYQEFIAQEMIHFSKYDCDRSIPNLVDGLKTSQRKIQFTAFKRRLTSEIKVAQFSGSVSEISCYHHGEQSLNGAIIDMAQNYVGSNNINILVPNGQFGSRLQGGKDSSAPRYIYTHLNKITRAIFPEADDHVLTYLNDDGTPVEPMYYAPIIPMILVNGSIGIGTGFSTDIMCYNPTDIINYIVNYLKTNEMSETKLTPYYEGFKGTITEIAPQKYLIKGCYDIISPKQVRITELPIGTWTDDYKQFLENLIDNTSAGKKKAPCVVRDYSDMSTDQLVNITITFAPNVLDDLIMKEEEYGCNALEKLLKLYTTRSTTNMHLFDENDKLTKFEKPKDIIDKFIGVRRGIYIKRKEYQIKALEHESRVLTNKARFISEILNDTLDLRKKKREQVVAMLIESKYDVIDEDTDYKYLVKMPMDTVTEENVNKLMKDKETKLNEMHVLKTTSVEQFWLNELEVLRSQYAIYTKEREESTNPKQKKTIKKISKKVSTA
jgi:DNA topoisomerase II